MLERLLFSKEKSPDILGIAETNIKDESNIKINN